MSALLTPVLSRFRRFAVAFLLMVPLGLNAQPAVGVAGTLPEDYLPDLKVILATALKQSPTMLQQNINLTLAQANRYAADSALWPGLSGGGSYGYSNARVSSNGTSGPASSSSGISYSVGLNQAIFQWGALKANSDIAKLGQQITQRQLAAAYRSLAGLLRSQYLSLVTKKISLRNTRAQLKLLMDGLAVQEAMIREGSISSGDIIPSRLAADDYRLTLQRAELDFDYSKSMFVRLAGLDQLADESIPGDLVHPAIAEGAADALLASITGGGALDTLQAQVDTLTVKQQDLGYKIAKTGLYPKFSFAAGYGVSNSQSVSGSVVAQSFVASYSYSVSAGWTLFDGFRTRGAKMSALAYKRSSERQLQTDIEVTIESAKNMRRQLRILADALNLAETRRALSEDGLKRATEEFKEGTVAQAALDATTSSFNATDYAAISARVDYLNRWSEFVSLAGADPVINVLPVSYLTLSHGK